MSDRIKAHAIDPAGGLPGQVPTINAAGTAVEYADAGSGFAPAAGRPPRLVPYGVKLRGANIVPMDSAGNPWATMYANWATKWDTIVKPQIDDAASVGANSIRLIGDFGGVHAGTLTVDAYVAAYEQFVDYCANLGLYVYACLGSAQHTGGATAAQAADIMVPTAAMLETKPNVIGIDVVQEVGLGSGYTHADVATMFAAIRAVTTLPLTCSNLGPNNSSAAMWSTSTTAAYADLVDFYDFHPYYLMSTSDLDPFFAANTTNKPLVLGEWGGTSTNLAVHTAASAVQAMPEVVGGFIWAIMDNSPTDDWALFDWSWNERTSVTTIFRTVPDHEGAFPGAGHTVQDEGSTLPARGRLNFVGGGATASDDPTNDATKITVPGLTVQDEDGTIATGVIQLDFRGAGVTVTPGTGEVLVTITGGGTSGGELLVQDGVTGPPVGLETEARDDFIYQG